MPHAVLGGRAACSPPCPSRRRTHPGPRAGTTAPRHSRGTDLHRSPPTLHSHERCRPGHRKERGHTPPGFGLPAQPAFPRSALPARCRLPLRWPWSQLLVADAPEPVLAGSSRPRPAHTLGSPVAEGAALAFAGCVRAAQTQAAGGPPWRVVRAAAVAAWRPLDPAEAGRLLSPFLGAARSHFTCIQE